MWLKSINICHYLQTSILTQYLWTWSGVAIFTSKLSLETTLKTQLRIGEHIKNLLNKIKIYRTYGFIVVHGASSTCTIKDFQEKFYRNMSVKSSFIIQSFKTLHKIIKVNRNLIYDWMKISLLNLDHVLLWNCFYSSYNIWSS